MKVKLKIDGTDVEVEVFDAIGRECLDKTEWMERLAGARLVDQVMKVSVGRQEVPVGSIV